MQAARQTTNGKTTRSAARERRKARAALLRAAEQYRNLTDLDDGDDYSSSAVCELLDTATDRLVSAALAYTRAVRG